MLKSIPLQSLTLSPLEKENKRLTAAVHRLESLMRARQTLTFSAESWKNIIDKAHPSIFCNHEINLEFDSKVLITGHAHTKAEEELSIHFEVMVDGAICGVHGFTEEGMLSPTRPGRHLKCVGVIDLQE
jgi:hypothetical protein